VGKKFKSDNERSSWTAEEKGSHETHMAWKPPVWSTTVDNICHVVIEVLTKRLEIEAFKEVR